MAPQWPEEVDVFTEPHSRMKKLVRKYSKMVSTTDFSKESHLKNLLHNLINVFNEFKAHEHIENVHIMRTLKRKLKAACVTSAAVCNCHSDNRLTDMLEMVVDGYRSQWTQKSAKERQSYGLQLQTALEDFTENFIPHMEEEEEVFQPMLMQYFSYEELKELKAKVIHEHLISTQKEKYIEDVNERDETLNAEEETSSYFKSLPDEICQNVFSFLNPQDLARAGQTCHRWNRLTKDPALWKGIYPVHWAQGNWTFYPEPLGGVDGLGEVERTPRVDLEPLVCHDEDADVDESSDTDDDKDYDSEENVQAIKEASILSALVKYLLPVAGSGVKVVDLAYSQGLSSNLVHKILKLCPNVEVLDLTHTHVGDAAFHEYSVSNRQSKLRHLDLTGCINITDEALFGLVNIPNVEAGCETQGEWGCVTAGCWRENGIKVDDCAWQGSDMNCRTMNIDVSCIANNNVDDSNEMVFERCCNNVTKTDLCLEEKGCDPHMWNEQSSTFQCVEDHDMTEYQRETDMPSNDSYFNLQFTPSDYQNMFCNDNTACCNSSPRPVVSTPYSLPKTDSCGFTLSKPTAASSSTTDSESNEFNGYNSETFCGSRHGTDCNFKTSYSSPLHCEKAEAENGCCSRGKGKCRHSRLDRCRSSAPTSCRLTNSRSLTHLKFLSLNGCFQISDQGLQVLTLAGGTPSLQHLDLSGCLAITGDAIKSLVSTCGPGLDHSQLFYCDNIAPDPFHTTANGCRNLGCGTRFCCSAD